MLEIYKKYLMYCLQDRKLSQTEIENLKALKRLLDLKDDDVRKIYKDVALSVYKEEVEKAIEDGRLSDEEKEFLENLRKELNIPEELAEKIKNELAHDFFKNLLSEAIADERLSSEEEQELEEVAKSLGLEISLDDATKQKLAKYKYLWQLENGDIPEIDKTELPIRLPKTERCYFYVDAVYYEPRKVHTGRVNYGGLTYRYRIAKGLYLRMGTLNFYPQTEEKLVPLDSGTVFITNKKILFVGNKGSRKIDLRRIIDFKPYRDGIQIIKDAGRSPFLKLDTDIELLVVLLNRLLSEI